MPYKTLYPWFFFNKTAKLLFVIFSTALIISFFLYKSIHKKNLVNNLSVLASEELEILVKSLKKHGDKDFCDLTKDALVAVLSSHKEDICRSVDYSDQKKYILLASKVEKDFTLNKYIKSSKLKAIDKELDKFLVSKILPISLLAYLIFLLLFYKSTRPLGMILSKVDRFRSDIPLSKNLELFYKKDEWSTIEEALNKADQRLQKQIEEISIENKKNTTILESINEDILAIDRFETILFFNTNFKNNFIKPRIGLEIDKKIWHIFETDVLEAFRKVLQSGESQFLKSKTFPQSENPLRLIDLTITPLKTSKGEISGALGVFYDVTDFKLAEQMRVDFVANVSHEIRTPLTSIKGFTQVLQGQSSKIDSALHPYLEKIVSNTERMISLFNDLLNLSVIESNNNLRLENFYLQEIMDSIEDNIKANYPMKNIIFENSIEDKPIWGDARLIEQVLLNLCDNACKYSEDAVIIKISFRRENDKTFITIKDNGLGISGEHLNRIFERFYRIEASRESLRGTGIGLAIVKQIITKHRGKILVESDGPGKGTSFKIELPAGP